MTYFTVKTRQEVLQLCNIEKSKRVGINEALLGTLISMIVDGSSIEEINKKVQINSKSKGQIIKVSFGLDGDKSKILRVINKWACSVKKANDELLSFQGDLRSFRDSLHEIEELSQ